MRDTNINTGLYTLTYYTFATLPAAAAGNVGQFLYITDYNGTPSTDNGKVAAGSGTTVARVRSDGAAWRISSAVL